MRRTLAVVLGIVLAAAVPAAAATKPDGQTFFEIAEQSWAVGTVTMSSSMTYRKGALLAFPAQLKDVIWSSGPGKPRNAMIVYEVPPEERGENAKPFFQKGDEIFAAVRLLPDHAYWKDNLPITRRHQIAGGRRYVFRGDDALEARRIMTAFFESVAKKGPERWKGELVAVASALTSPVAVLREDASRFLAGYRSLARDYDPAATPPIEAYLAGTAPAAEKAPLATALGLAGLEPLKATLARLATGSDALAAGARRGLEGYGEVPATADLVELSRSGSADLKSYAADALGRRSGGDDAAFARASALLAAGGQDPALAAAAAGGLGRSGGARVVPVLGAAIARGNGASGAAAEALADFGGPEATAALAKALKTGKGEAALAATAGLGRMSEKGCEDCVVILTEQQAAHADEKVRLEIARVLANLPRSGR